MLASNGITEKLHYSEQWSPLQDIAMVEGNLAIS